MGLRGDARAVVAGLWSGVVWKWKFGGEESGVDEFDVRQGRDRKGGSFMEGSGCRGVDAGISVREFRTGRRLTRSEWRSRKRNFFRAWSGDVAHREDVVGSGMSLSSAGEANLGVAPSRLPLRVGRRSENGKDREAKEDSGAFVRKLMSRVREGAIFRGLAIWR